MKNNEIDKTINFLETMLLDDDDYGSETEKTIFSYYVIIIIHTLEFFKENESKYINMCSDCMIEIINQAKFDEYNSQNKNCSEKELTEYVDEMIDEEVKKEIIKKFTTLFSLHVSCHAVDF
jgi:alpha-N-acetylglucosamine transferase